MAPSRAGGRGEVWRSCRGLVGFCLLYYLFAGAMYNAIQDLCANAEFYVVPRTAIDRWVPFDERFIWIYLLHYILPLLVILCIRLRVANYWDMMLSYFIVFNVAFIVFLIYPTKMIRADDTGSGLSGKLVRLLYSVDGLPNNLPSFHVAVSTLTGFIAWHHSRRWGIIFSVAVAGIAVSTLFVKQHWFLDVVAGMALGIATYFWVYRKRRITSWIERRGTA